MKRASAAVLCVLLILCLTGCVRRETKTVVRLDSHAQPAAPENTEESKPESDTLAGDWYGWWRMKNTSGDWAKMYGYYWDCCAEIRVSPDGAYTALLWDEELPKDNCLADAVLRQGERLSCESGSFLDRELSPGDWSIELSEDAGGKLLTIQGEYEAVGKGGFHYDIYLRPWGSRWPGSADERPFGYESWYLPLIEAGSPMPETMGK